VYNVIIYNNAFIIHLCAYTLHRPRAAASESISVYVINTRIFSVLRFKQFFHIILYTHAHTHITRTLLSRSSYVAFTEHTHTNTLIHICVWVPVFTRACVCMCVYRYCIVGTWSRTWSLGIRRVYECGCMRVCVFVRV